MNKRFKELALQAGLLNDQSECSAAKLEMFAQLIIKDCLTVVENRTNGSYDITMTKETRAVWNIWIEIKEHFGTKNGI